MLGDFLQNLKKRIKKENYRLYSGRFLFLVILIAGGDWGYLKFTKIKFTRVFTRGPVSLGGMTAAEVKGLVENFNNRLWREGIDLLAVDSRGEIKKIEIDPFISSESVTPPVILDSDDLAARALLTGRSGQLVGEANSALGDALAFAVASPPVKPSWIKTVFLNGSMTIFCA